MKAPLPGPGGTIRTMRKRAGLTLAELSGRTGLAVSTLSKLEMGQVSLSYDKLMTISKGLGLDMAELLDSTPHPGSAPTHGGRRVVHRAGDGQHVETRSYSQSYLATELLNKRMTPIHVELHARTLDEFIDRLQPGTGRADSSQLTTAATNLVCQRGQRGTREVGRSSVENLVHLRE